MLRAVTAFRPCRHEKGRPQVAYRVPVLDREHQIMVTAQRQNRDGGTAEEPGIGAVRVGEGAGRVARFLQGFVENCRRGRIVQNGIARGSPRHRGIAQSAAFGRVRLEKQDVAILGRIGGLGGRGKEQLLGWFDHQAGRHRGKCKNMADLFRMRRGEHHRGKAAQRPATDDHAA